jgi:hypothetical protein
MAQHVSLKQFGSALNTVCKAIADRMLVLDPTQLRNVATTAASKNGGNFNGTIIRR